MEKRNIPKLNAFNTFYLNRKTNGGGVAILVKESIQAALIILPQTPNVEAVGTTIKLKNNKSIDIISVYCADGNANTKQDIIDILNTTINSYVIGGDLNAHSAIWEDDHQQNRCGK